MEVKLNLPPKAVRMIQALNALRGNRGAADIEGHLSNLIVRELKREIAEECGLYASSAPVTAPEEPKKPVIDSQEMMPQTFETQEDVTHIAEGLGDDFDYDTQEEADETPGGNLNMPNRKGAVTEQEIENDMAVANPDTEAKVEAPPVEAEAQAHPEDTFQQMVLGEQQELPVEELDPRIAKRKYRNPNARRAKVEGFSGDNPVMPSGGLTI